ncbi:MAG: hypothetical protein Mars2KO_42560 [Maribacter sp.]
MKKKKGIIIALLLITVIGTLLFFGVRSILFGGLQGPDIVGSVETFTYDKKDIPKEFGIDEDLVLKIYKPNNFDPNRKYPIIYLLDGDSLFEGAAGYLSEELKNNPDAAAILIGLGYGYYNSYLADFGKGRWRDYTFKEDEEFEDVANGPKFYDFLSEKLVPEMNKKFNGDFTNSTLIGHSCGGDFTFYAFLQYDPIKKEKNPFTNFIVGDGGDEAHFKDIWMPHFAETMNKKEGRAYAPLHFYRVYGYLVDPTNLHKVEELHLWLENKNFENISSHRYYPLKDDHAATMKTTIVNGIKIALGDDSFKKYEDESSHRF